MNYRISLSPLVIIIATSVSACQQPVIYEHTETISGVDYKLSIYGHTEKQSNRAIEAIFAELRLLAGYTDPVQSKPMARTNVLLRGGEWFSVNPSVTQILKQSIHYHDLTGGLFNPAVLGALKEKYGLYQTETQAAAPSQRELQNFLAAPPTMKHVNFDGIRLQGTHPGIRLDFDYLAYGYAIDIEMDHLRELGIKNAALRIGGVQRIMGSKAALAHPFRFSRPGQPAASVGSAFCQRSIGTGNRMVLHPATGQPISDVRSIELVANTASDASVACWVLLLSPMDKWETLASRIGVSAAVLESSEGQYHVWPNVAP